MMVYLFIGAIAVVILLVFPVAHRALMPVLCAEAARAGPLQHSLGWTSGFV